MHLSKEPSKAQGQWRATENTPPSITLPPKSNHYSTLETTTNSQVQQKRDLWAWMKRAAMRLSNPVAKKQQREAWEDGRMSCSNRRDSGFCSNLISPFNSFLHLNTRYPEYMSLPPKQGSNYPRNSAVLNGEWNKHSLEGSLLLVLNNRVLMTELVTPLRCTMPTAQSKSCFCSLYTENPNGFHLNSERTCDNVVVAAKFPACTAQFCPEAKVSTHVKQTICKREIIFCPAFGITGKVSSTCEQEVALQLMKRATFARW